MENIDQSSVDEVELADDVAVAAAEAEEVAASGSGLDAKVTIELKEYEALKLGAAEAVSQADRFLRLTAEYENYRRRVAKEKLDLMATAAAKLVTDMLPILDNFERARQHQEMGTDELLSGIWRTVEQLEAAMEKAGLSKMETVGKPFDPSVHEAVMHSEVEGCEPETVTEELLCGYMMASKVLRAAMVKVAK